jgi:hypothetical protein
MNMKKVMTLILALLSIGVSVKAQSKIEGPYIVLGNASTCEENAVSIDNLANALRSSDARLFIVARLGKGESSRELNRRRLYNVRTYFKGWQIDARRFVFAEGDRVEGEGRIEFYIGSTFMQVSLVKRGRDICVDCCDYPDSRYYGLGKKDKLKRSRQ